MNRSTILNKLALTGLFALTLSFLTFAASVTEVPQSRFAPIVTGQN